MSNVNGAVQLAFEPWAASVTNGSRPDADESLGTREALTLFLDAKAVKGLTPTTLYNYQWRLEQFARFCPRLPTSPEPIEAFLGQHIGPHSRDTYYRLFRNLYRWLVRRRLIKHNPIKKIEPPKLPRKVARSLTRVDLQQLLSHPSHPPEVSALLFLLADTGLRLGEALSIRTQSQFGYGTVVVSGKTGQRRVPVSDRVRDMVEEQLPWPWTRVHSAGNRIRQAFRRVGITGPRSSAQTLRHTFVRLWEGDEGSLVGIMGWTTNRMLNVYRPYDAQRAKAEHELNSPLSRTLAA